MIGENIKKFRVEKGLSQIELASMLGVESAYICMFERGKRKPNRRMIFALANIFKVTVVEIDPDFEFFFLERDLLKRG